MISILLFVAFILKPYYLIIIVSILSRSFASLFSDTAGSVVSSSSSISWVGLISIFLYFSWSSSLLDFYNLLCIFVSSTICFHSFLSRIFFFQFVTSMILRSFITYSRYLILGLPLGLSTSGFYSITLLVAPVTWVLMTYPNQLKLTQLSLTIVL